MKGSVLKKFCEYEKKGGSFPLLPYKYRWVSITVIVLSAIGYFTRFHLGLLHEDVWRHLFKSFMLLGLLAVIISKEKEEDERISNLRFRAFGFAFVFSLLMFILIPFFTLIKELIFSKVHFEIEQSVFYIFSMMMFFQAMYFHIFKRQL